MNTIDIWKDMILIKWDGVIPSNAPKNSVLTAADVIHFWPHLKGYIKWYKSMAKFGMRFSKQNIKRIHAQFGQIPIQSGASRIKALKLEDIEIYEMLEKAQKVISFPIERLPQYEYKMPPLGAYQHRGIVFLRNVKRAALFADCGCLSGDSIIPMNRNKNSRKLKISDLFLEFHRRKKSTPTRVRSLCDGGIRLNNIIDVKESGCKHVYKVTLADGKAIKATKDHPLMTDGGWVQVKDLKIGTEVMVDNMKRHKKKPFKKAPKKYNDKRKAVGKYHPYARKQLSHQGRSHSFLLEIHRATYEAHINGMGLKEFIAKTYDPSASELRCIDPEIYGIHHINGDHYDNSPENLTHMTHREHAQHHTAGYSNFNHGIPEYSTVKSLESLGAEMTYDICCEAPNHNFVANGIVVHNSGKTYMVANSTEMQIKSGELERGATLICSKLSTLETGWLEDLHKFTDLTARVLWLPAGKKNRKEKIVEMLQDPVDLYIINHDGVRVYKDDLIKKNFKKVVVDESTILKSFRSMDPRARGGAFAKALMEVAHMAEYKVIMSGTPAPNGPEDLWGQYAFLDPQGIMLEPSFNDFREKNYDLIDLRPRKLRYIIDKNTGEFARDPSGKFISKPMTPRTPKKYVPKKGAVEELNKLVSKSSYRIKIRDHIKDLPDLSVIDRIMSMDRTQQGHYNDMKKKLKVEIDETRITVPIQLNKIMKLRQITGGFIIDNQQEYHTMKVNPKMEELDSLVNDEIDSEDKIVIFAEYRWEIETIVKRYKNYRVVSVYGGNTSTKNLKAIKDFREDPEVRIIVLHPKSAAHGITLTMANYLIFYSFSHSAEDNYQAIKRIERAGQKNAMFVYYLMMKGSIDTAMKEVLKLKGENQRKLIDQEELNKITQNDLDNKLLDLWRDDE